MPTIRVEMLPGRTTEQKKVLAANLTQVMIEHANASPASVHVIFTEVEPNDWAVAGELLVERLKPASGN